MTVELPTAGERFEAQLVEDRYGVLWLYEAQARLGRRAAQAFSLVVVLRLGWRLVRPSSEEQALFRGRVLAQGGSSSLLSGLPPHAADGSSRP
jgi:hypothetical protein